MFSTQAILAYLAVREMRKSGLHTEYPRAFRFLYWVGFPVSVIGGILECGAILIFIITALTTLLSAIL